jgi:hypothetical protein
VLLLELGLKLAPQVVAFQGWAGAEGLTQPWLELSLGQHPVTHFVVALLHWGSLHLAAEVLEQGLGLQRLAEAAECQWLWQRLRLQLGK